jgi:PEP-CTERM motif
VYSLLAGAPLIVLSLLALGAPLFAEPIIDPPNDILSTFNGPPNGDLDVLNAEVSFDGANFIFRSTENGPIGTTPNSLFVWGVDRGLQNQFFGDFRSDVLFDVIVVLRPDLTGTVIDFSPHPDAPVNLEPGSVTVDGNMIQGVVPANLLPTRGFQPADYKVNLWPRTGLDNNGQIADFAPENSTAVVTLTPEPSSLLFLGGGLVILALSRRRARQ